MEIHFHLGVNTVNTLTWEEYETFERLQDGEALKLYRLRPVLARFVVDDNNLPVSHADAMKALGKVSMPQIKDVVAQFMANLKDSTVPKVSGDSLNSPSAPAPEVSESPAGSE